jgi:hypothetical protein
LALPIVTDSQPAQADDRLSDASLDASFKEILPDDECTVVAQDRRPGTELEEFSEVNLRCTVQVPRVVGRKAEVAESTLFDQRYGAAQCPHADLAAAPTLAVPDQERPAALIEIALGQSERP